MQIDEWWGLIERARRLAGDRADDRGKRDDPLPDALTDVLAELGTERIVDFVVTSTAVTDAAYTHDLWNAAYLIEDGCSDDGFMDFRDGLALLGRETFTKAVADPDSLADVPLVVRMSRHEGGRIRYEALHAIAKRAYERLRHETEFLEAVLNAVRPGTIGQRDASGEYWDPEDRKEMERHLPRLAAMFPE